MYVCMYVCVCTWTVRHRLRLKHVVIFVQPSCRTGPGAIQGSWFTGTSWFGRPNGRKHAARVLARSPKAYI